MLIVAGVVGVIGVVVAIAVFRPKLPFFSSHGSAQTSQQGPAAAQQTQPESAAGGTAEESGAGAAAASSADAAGPNAGTAAPRKAAQASARHDHRASARSRSASASVAGSDRDVLSKRVSLAGLDLSTETGACTALRRIKRAADEVCPDDDGLEVYWMRQRRECVQDSVARAVKATRSPRVEALRAKGSRGC
jgi:UrcA family protein